MRSGGWYYKDRLGRTRGPLELITLKTAWGAGIIDKNTFIWGEDMDEWAPIHMIYGMERAIATWEGLLNSILFLSLIFYSLIIYCLDLSRVYEETFMYVFWPFWHCSLWWLMNIELESRTYKAFEPLFLYEPVRWKDIRLMDYFPLTVKMVDLIVFSSALQINNSFFLWTSYPVKNLRWEELFSVIFQICVCSLI